jgi:hypothetical protein
MPRPFVPGSVETTLLTPWPVPLALAWPSPASRWALEAGHGTLQQRLTACYAQLRALPRRTRRALQRKLALPLASVALLLALGAGLGEAATIVVDGTTCTLVDAITAANTDRPQGGCPAGSGADTLVLEPPGHTVTLTREANRTYGPTGLPVISSPITIAGQGGTIARAPNAPPFRLLAFNNSGNLSLQEVTVTGGVSTDESGQPTGAGVYNYRGTVTLTRSVITGNDGGGVMNYAYYDPAHVSISQSLITDNRGPGVLNQSCYYCSSTSATVMLIESVISRNTGRGIENLGGTITITNSTISGNTAIGVGGGVLNVWGSITLLQSTISANTASGSGGGMFNYGPATLLQTTISANTASGWGGGMFNYSRATLLQSTISGNTAAEGGGVVNEGFSEYCCTPYHCLPCRGYAKFTLTQSTISGNTATGLGGGMVNRAYDYGDAVATLTHSTITGNTALEGGGVVTSAPDGLNDSTLTLSLTGSLVAGNRATTAPEALHSGGTLKANAFNLFGVRGTAGVEGFTPGPTDQVPAEPLTAILDPILADHGGPTLTHALVPGSPALDAIPWGANGCGTTNFSDQRWQARPQPAGGACDIGAYEVAVAGQPLAAWVVGMTPHTAVCENTTSGQAVTLNDPAPVWDCEAAGLAVTSGDQIALRVRGPVKTGATDVGGAVVGMAPSGGGCTNRTTGQQVKFQALFQGEPGATAASCVAAGLKVHPGDTVQMHTQGIAE